MWFGGVYDNKGTDVQLAQFAVDVDDLFVVNSDMVIPEDQKEAFLSDRAGALVGKSVADRFGWGIGDTFHTKSNLFNIQVELKVRGIYEGGGDQGGGVYFHWKYFDEAIKGVMGDIAFTGTYSILARTPEDVPIIAEEVDALFKNTTSPTKTETEKAFILGFVSMLGNVQLLIGSICSAVIFAVILVAANTMAMSFRERAREVGILKALGFRKSQVLSLMMGESLIITLGGTLLGSILARVLFDSVDLGQTPVVGGFLAGFRVDNSTLVFCSGIGILVGVLSAGFPAWQTARRPVVEALRKVV
jgi:putative ABC transport system permease protein